MTKAEREKVKTVYEAFSKYIHESSCIAWGWNEKLGYYLMRVDPRPDKMRVTETILIKDAYQLVRLLFDEICLDVLLESGMENTVYTADKKERREIRRRWLNYTSTVPQYSEVYNEFFTV